MDVPGSEMDRMPYSSGAAGWMCLFSAIACSMGRVTSCSTSWAVAPGHRHRATPTRTGISGSLRCGIEKYPYVPHATENTSAAQAIWRCSTKNREAFRVRSIRSRSLRCGTECSSRDHTHLLAIAQEGGAEGHDAVPARKAARDFDRIAKGLTDPDGPCRCVGFSAAPDQAEDREPVRIGWRADDRREGHDEPRLRAAGLAENQGTDHAGPDVLARVVQGHFDGEDAALRIGLRGIEVTVPTAERCRGSSSTGCFCPRRMSVSLKSGTAKTALT